jgi:hypothetical protein
MHLDARMALPVFGQSTDPTVDPANADLERVLAEDEALRVTNGPGAPSTCEACGASFTCGASTSACWCSSVKVSENVRADLQTRYDQCLCPACLERAAQSAPPANRV